MAQEQATSSDPTNEIVAEGQNGAEQITAEVDKAWSTIDSMVDGFVALLPKIAVGAVVFVLFIGLAFLAKRLVVRFTRQHPSAHIGRVFGRLVQWTVIVLGGMLAIAIIAPSVTPAKLLGALGVGSVAIGFAFKDVLQNFLAGMLILLRQPFKIGDSVKFGEHEGVVEEIDTRLTIIKTYDGKQVLVPNGEIYTNPITVMTAYDRRRQQYDVGIGYDDDIGEACEAILNSMKNAEGVLDDPQPDVIVIELGGSSVNIRARWWSKTSNVSSVKSRVIRAIKEALDAAGVDMPYPTQVTLFHDKTPKSRAHTDGEDHDSKANDAAGSAARERESANCQRRSYALTDDIQQ